MPGLYQGGLDGHAPVELEEEDGGEEFQGLNIRWLVTQAAK
jgi:hypothetical protein